MLKKILIGLAVILIAIQFVKPEKNISDDNTYAINTKYEVPADVKQILEVACNDCHTNKTVYPWYSNVQPIAWFLDHHVVDGKRHYNLSTYTKLPIAVQNHKFEETIEMVKEKEMPLESYTYFGLHKEAKLTDEQRNILINWAQAQMDSLKAHYPADSLKMKPRPKPAK
jgi:Haem-binding domain